jgi:opacity protein-like surface antigen
VFGLALRSWGGTGWYFLKTFTAEPPRALKGFGRKPAGGGGSPKTVRLTIVLLFTSLSASAQILSVGVRGGVPINDFFDSVQGQTSSFVNNTNRYVVGPSVSLNLPFGFSIQGDALYRRLGVEYTRVGSGTAVSATSHSWQFPILGKLTLLPGPIRPFVNAGPSFQRLSRIKELPTTVTNPSSLNNDTSVGFTFGGGVQLRLGKRVRIEPEFRYTRWGSDALANPFNTIFNMNRNQGDLLVGILF